MDSKDGPFSNGEVTARPVSLKEHRDRIKKVEIHEANDGTWSSKHQEIHQLHTHEAEHADPSST